MAKKGQKFKSFDEETIQKVVNEEINKGKSYLELTLIMGALFKGQLDLLRYSHINKIISINQIVSLIIITISLLSIYIRQKYK